MKVKVEREGVLVPRELLEGVEEVEILKERHRILVIPVEATDPIWEFGEDPAPLHAPDASEKLDSYLYDSP